MGFWQEAGAAAGIVVAACLILGGAWLHARTRRALQATRQRLQALAGAVDFSGDAIVILNRDSSINFANRQFELRTRLSLGELTGRKASEATGIPPAVAEALARAATSGSNWSGHAASVLPGGQVREEDVFVTTVHRGDGATTGFVAIFRDVTGRVADARENDRLAAAVRYSAESIEILDASGRIQYVNPAYERSQNVVLAEVLGQRPEDVENVVVQDGNYHEMLKASGEEGRVWSGLIKSRLPHGTLLEEQVTVSPIRDDSGQLTSYVIVKRDVTATRQLEMQLARAQKLEAIGQLAAGIAHEVNTPMQFVGDNLSFLQRSFRDVLPILERLSGPAAERLTAGDGELRALIGNADLEFVLAEVPRAIEQSLDGCQRIAHIVKAMKDFSHPGTEMTAVDINRAITSTITVATNEWKYLAEIQLDLDPDLPRVTCNGGEVNQVILNMLVNAAHAIGEAAADRPGHRGVIAVSTRRCEGGIAIAVADNGAGIPPEIRGRLFDPFFTTKEVGKGTGQGLAIAHDVIVRKHRGAIDVESEVGKGTTFTLRLPDAPQRPSPLAAEAA